MKKLNELNLKNKKVMIFDLDGTLIDSIGVWTYADQELIKKYAGIEVDLDKIQTDRNKFFSENTNADIYVAYCKFLIDKYNLKITDPNKVSDIRINTANTVLKSEIEFKEKAVELILKLKELGYILVLATGTSKSQLKIYYTENKKMLDKMNINDVFDLIVTKDEINKQKPDPEIYIKIIDYLNVNADECLVFEDSYIGVLSANNAGMEVVNVYDKYSDFERDKINIITDYSISNYEEFLEII